MDREGTFPVSYDYCMGNGWLWRYDYCMGNGWLWRRGSHRTAPGQQQRN
jgi:hypothetical protein